MRYLWPAVTVLALLACADQTGPLQLRALLDLGGHFAGTWHISAWDPNTSVCDIGGADGGGSDGCYHPQIGQATCQIALDLTMTGDTTFSGTFATDTAAACLARLAGLSLATTGTVTEGVVISPNPASPGRQSSRITFSLGATTPDDFERQFGCVLASAVPTWVMQGRAFSSAPGGATQLLQGNAATPSGDFDIPVQCAGRAVLLVVAFSASRV